MKTRVLPAVGAILLVLGGLWALQGAGAVGGGAMSGHSQWLVIGIIVALVGVALLVSGVAKRRTGRR
jgi:asparagine N-glycosylation enzyme membrane subunit Stt3